MNNTSVVVENEWRCLNIVEYCILRIGGIYLMSITLNRFRPSRGKAGETVEPRECVLRWWPLFQHVAGWWWCTVYQREKEFESIGSVRHRLCFDMAPVLAWYNLTRTLLNQQTQWRKLTKPSTCMDARSLAAKNERYDRVNVTRTAMVFVPQWLHQRRHWISLNHTESLVDIGSCYG